MKTQTLPVPLAPIVGMGATIRGYSDSMACTVISVSPNGKTIRVQRDTATLLNSVSSGAPDALKFEPGGFCGHTSGVQRYEYATNPEGEVTTFSLRKTGRWIEANADTRGGPRLTLGVRDEHYDFNF